MNIRPLHARVLDLCTKGMDARQPRWWIVVFVVAVVVFGQLRTLLTHGRTRAYKYNYATCIVCAQQHTIL